MKELTHFVDGKHVRGISGRFGDGFEPLIGEVISRVEGRSACGR
jgi:malonate-semialdehyde dehydrogenase (acetylating) / methylmalonate-semialdehyde dehydrogenase